MTYEQLIETVSVIIADERIQKKGLMLSYTLPEHEYRKINEVLFYKNNPTANFITYDDEFEIEIAGIVVKLTKIVGI
jgi:hypothetical protein